MAYLQLLLALAVATQISWALRLQVPEETPKLVFDLGMNTGMDTENFLKMGYKVLAVEANPMLAKEVGSRPMEMEARTNGKLKILNVGISNSSGETLDFWIPSNPNTPVGWDREKYEKLLSGGGSFTAAFACRGASCYSVKVPTMSCTKLLEAEGNPYYMKIDIEGKDISCLMDVMENRCGSQLPPYVSFENYGFDTWVAKGFGNPLGDAKKLMALMHARGYTQWKRSRTWASVYAEKMGVSGEDSAFGEDLLDLETTKQWKPTSDFSKEFGCDVNCTTQGFICGGWCDMHAKLDPVVAKESCKTKLP